MVLPDHPENANDSQRLEYKKELEELVLRQVTKLAQKRHVSNDHNHEIKLVPNQLEVLEIVCNYLDDCLYVVNHCQNVAHYV